MVRKPAAMKVQGAALKKYLSVTKALVDVAFASKVELVLLAITPLALVLLSCLQVAKLIAIVLKG